MQTGIQCQQRRAEGAGKETEYKQGYSMSNAEQRVLGRRQNTNWDTVFITPSRGCAEKETKYKLGYSMSNAEQRVCWEGDRTQTGIQYV